MRLERAATFTLLALFATSGCGDACGGCLLALSHIDLGPPPKCVIDDGVEITVRCEHVGGTGGGNDINHIDPATFHADEPFLDDNPHLTRPVDIAHCAQVCFQRIAED